MFVQRLRTCSAIDPFEETDMRKFVHAVAAHIRATTRNLTFAGTQRSKRSPASSYSWLSFPLD